MSITWALKLEMIKDPLQAQMYDNLQWTDLLQHERQEEEEEDRK